jgi:hypothetical protein
MENASSPPGQNKVEFFLLVVETNIDHVVGNGPKSMHVILGSVR